MLSIKLPEDMIWRIQTAVLFCLLLSFKLPDDDLIQWRSSYRLTWNDFKGSPPANAANAALTSSGILMKFSTNGTSLKYQISCNFVKHSSWGRIRNEHILTHEQGHFDIAEIYARKLNKELKAYRYNNESVSKDVNAIYKSVMNDLLQLQNLYDGQTDYSRNFEQQKIWLAKIDGYLEDLREFAPYERIASGSVEQ